MQVHVQTVKQSAPKIKREEQHSQSRQRDLSAELTSDRRWGSCCAKHSQDHGSVTRDNSNAFKLQARSRFRPCLDLVVSTSHNIALWSVRRVRRFNRVRCNGPQRTGYEHRCETWTCSHAFQQYSHTGTWQYSGRTAVHTPLVCDLHT